MSILKNAKQAIRLAGTNLGTYLSSPQTAKAIGQQVALQTAVGTVLGQGVPRMMGRTPSESPLQTAKRAALSSAISSPVSGGVAAMGVPHLAAGPAGDAAGMLGSHFLSGFIDPEPHEQPQASGADMQNFQQFHAAHEQQRYNNEINLALAKNYHNPTTTIVHKNPSAEFDTVQKMLNPNVRY